eukprot:gnl/Chilomastix_caulleri/5717.p1 GENE.gnl/Chilomastix_caulleri/5717~~gnl/Chilomastix_caulleri/5717.p1  ORF type:complete len:62 (-),score=10.83 gnl/Chilomastix_caulleri/5717:42-227(-)
MPLDGLLIPTTGCSIIYHLSLMECMVIDSDAQESNVLVDYCCVINMSEEQRVGTCHQRDPK